MRTSLHFHNLLLALLLLTSPAMAAKFVVKDVSGEPACVPAAFVQSLVPGFYGDQYCNPNPAGTVEVIVTPEPGELPIACYDNGSGGKFCMYSAGFYIAAYYQGQWMTKTGYAWTPVDMSQIQPNGYWPPWSGTTSMGYLIEVGELNLNTSMFDPPLAGIEVYFGLAPAGKPVFTPNMVAKVYPVSKP